MKLFVFHTPELAPPHLVPDCAIAVDVLRATSTIATALAAGAEAVQVFSSMEQLMHDSEAWPIDRRLRAGERGGAMVEGCDLGNSPLECTPDRVGGKRLFISTTNGTRCLERVQSTPSVLTAAMINRASVVKHLLAKQPETVWIVGSGWEGAYSLEDTVCAGAIAHSLTAQLDVDLAGNDEVVAAIALFSAWKDNLLKLFHQASHGKRLLRLACDTDLEYCAQLDSIDILPMQREVGVLIGDPQLSEVATRS